jgi:uncharacterized protein with HEPN domain
MSKRSSAAKLAFIVEMIENIELIIERHGGVSCALEDTEGQLAILMAMTQIGETLHRLDTEIIKETALETVQKGAYDLRNYIVHDYDGVDLYIVEDAIVNRLPQLKQILTEVMV